MNSNKFHVSKWIIYLIVIAFNLHEAIFAYISSSFLAQFIGIKNVGFIFTGASLLLICSFIIIRPILKKFGNYHSFLAVVLLEIIALLLLSFSTSATVLITFYIIGHIMRGLAYFHLDIFLEDLSIDKDTGKIRGVYLTVSSFSYIIGPTLAGVILTNTDYWKVFLSSAVILLPVVFISLRYLSRFKDPEYKEINFIKTAKRILTNHNLFSLFIIHSLLKFFYAWVVLYIPFYLITNIGFSVSETTFIIAIALTAFVILEYPLGYIADRYLGEKEFLILGFIIISISTALLSFITEANFWVWAVALFSTRIGASMIEVMNETYFFKKINSSDINVLGFFRILGPLAYTVAPLIASILLMIIDIRFLFLILGAIMLYGVKHSLALKDTL
jgi:MFS family permease